jgi:hypothetical protein
MKNIVALYSRIISVALLVAITGAAHAQEAKGDDAAELAKKLSNPVASLISIPIQFNWDGNYGPNDRGEKTVTNIQPVWPFSLGEKWNLITRTIVPLVGEKDVPAGTDVFGLGDILQSFFFSPKDPVNGWILAIGPVVLYPSATDTVLGGGKWAAGPTALALQQKKGWTYGILANHLNSFAGHDDRAEIKMTFIQPFISFTTKSKTTFGLNTESTYDWNNLQWSVPLNLSVSQLVKVGKLPVSLSAGVRYWAEAPDNGPEGFAGRVSITFLFPT